ncbi:GNAT family N-acetyltransferase [Actinotalea sp. K2]|uniref:GNAT family N-acetyltransferase n=1 Tax=Actinotalea sp. K2 TaxID=2939438 RepID=UPI0020170D24|nr:GNAT family N-acetyltransferase [Actinotalea sp. K2]MCL3859630.1 GNAT family N-acetyltransferase [Actinotalea sp. K2]
MEVRRLAREDLPVAARMFAVAFDSDPMSRLMLPDDDQRRRFLERGGRRQIERAIPHRHVFGAYHDGTLCGIAVWLPPGVAVRSAEAIPASAALRALRVGLRHPRLTVRYLRARAAAMKALHQSGAWHLAFLATDPRVQGRGVARRLLDRVLRRADEDAVGVWLETYDPANPPIYERFDFRTTTELTGSGVLPRLWLMERPPADG